ncbi:MAG: hormogonium polysaccharide biosynthesis protein HpsA [Potamolinea sp.]
MSTRKQPSNIIRRLVKQVWRFFQYLTKALINWFLRTLFVLKRRTGQNQAGFVLPTIVMVMLVVILLTTAILFRSFNRPKNASNMRVDQATYAAATPSLERARAKLKYLFSTEETGLKGNTPDDTSIAEVFEGPKYTFGDETQVKLVSDFNGQGGIQDEERLQTAWKFPVDTDNNGRFDSYTLYGIYFRNPPTPDASNNKNPRKRGPIEARSLPQDEGDLQGCGSAGNAGGTEGWTVQSNGQLKKSFFTYVATVPITTTAGLVPPAQFEAKLGSNKGFSGLEMQQDQARIALDNNAVWYRNDLEIIDPAKFNVNGRVHTNGNLLVAGSDADTIHFYQVSSPGSCQYNAENSKILVGGNVIAGALDETSNRGNTLVQVDLFKPKQKPDTTEYIDSSNVTTKTTPALAASNNEAYDLRLNLLVKGAMNLHNQTTPQARKMPTKASVGSMGGRFPKTEVIEAFNKKVEKCDPDCKDSRSVLENLIKKYFEARIRKVTNAEVPIADTLTATGTLSDRPRDPNFVFSGGGTIAAPKDWMLLDDSITKVPLNINGSLMKLDANKPTGNNDTVEKLLGDRILVGNGLPYQWLKTGTGTDEKDFAKPEEAQPVRGVNWNDGGERERRSRVKPVTEVDDTSRDGYWEGAAAFTGTAKEENSQNPELLGGLRVITGAGIYVDGRGPTGGGTGKRLAEDTTAGRGDVRSFLPTPPTVEQLKNKGVTLPQGILARQLTVVWPETMPSYQWIPPAGIQQNSDTNRDNERSPGEGMKGDLQMKATVVYHYASDPNNAERAPIACISSYYNNAGSFTAKNDNLISNNGINYNPAPLIGQRSVTPRLQRQARMIFPDGRLVNEPLKEALDSLKDGLSLTLSEIAALDAANCALNILDGSAAPAGSPIPDGAIKEAAFLDSRQVKALHKSEKAYVKDGQTFDAKTLLTDLAAPKKLEIAELAELGDLKEARYDLPMEQRQPLEIRVTEIDLSRATGINRAYQGTEYLIPNSGIIYATRDDALADISDPKGNSSATDFKLDPTRHPNGIRLVKGQNLARVDTFRKEEKGFILASDLPVYIKGDFNLHLAPGGTGGQQMEEFNTPLLPDYNNFYDRTRVDRNKKFACREKGSGCEGSGDQWRAARIISDAISIQSKVFEDGLRADGDYDLNNNAGNWAVESRLKNGFWWNSFATTAPWLDTGTGKPKNSSYVMNDVTPIQRRAEFPEYLMETCTKLPVSECAPGDWKFSPGMASNQGTAKEFIGKALPQAPNAGNPNLPRNTNAGTTANEPVGNFKGYVRRVAFKRNEFGAIKMPDTCTGPTDCNAIPLGINTANRVDGAEYGTSPLTASTAPNALWFWTTINNSNPTSANPSYNNNNKLYYFEEKEVPPVVGQTVHEKQLFLPGTPEFPYAKTIAPAAQPLNLLNGITEDDPSDFTVCMGGVAGKQLTGPITGGTCPPATQSAITAARTALVNLTDATIDGENLVAVNKTWSGGKSVAAPAFPAAGAAGTPSLTATAKVNVYDLPTDGKLGTAGELTITLDRGNQSDPIFVFRKTTGFQPLTFGKTTDFGVKLVLKGVSPNNIFWVANRVRINPGPATPNTTTLAGNFLGGGKLTITGDPKLEGVRFLGFSGLATGSDPFPGTMTAMTSTDEPLLVPVLQLHSPTGKPGDAATAFGSEDLQKTWLPAATETNVNAVLVMGDSPSRPLTTGAESGGGLQNFPRFMELWTNQPNKINGSLIQFRRSSFATAPFQPIDDPKRDTSLFFDTAAPDYTIETGSDYRYRGGADKGLAPFYMPPSRAWGYDVGLLSQSPDLFSKNFATPSAGSPNEYYREVGKDDEWVKPLLCAVQKADPKDPTSPFNTPAVGTIQERPKSCPDIGSYQ